MSRATVGHAGNGETVAMLETAMVSAAREETVAHA
jgi:hypothetical protein